MLSELLSQESVIIGASGCRGRGGPFVWTVEKHDAGKCAAFPQEQDLTCASACREEGGLSGGA